MTPPVDELCAVLEAWRGFFQFEAAGAAAVSPAALLQLQLRWTAALEAARGVEWAHKAGRARACR